MHGVGFGGLNCTVDVAKTAFCGAADAPCSMRPLTGLGTPWNVLLRKSSEDRAVGQMVSKLPLLLETCRVWHCRCTLVPLLEGAQFVVPSAWPFAGAGAESEAVDMLTQFV